MNSREYNKLHVATNRSNVEKIWMGFQQDTKDILLRKDQETYFHIPFFAEPVKLVDSRLIADGAAGGLFPAASDRIFKNKKDYGNVTPFGNPVSDLADGTWFCSWLFRFPNGKLQWYDRYYKPGEFVYENAISQLNDVAFETKYINNDKTFRDVPSTLVLDPGVMYKYFHIGEQTANFLLASLAGENNEKVVLDLINWGTEKVDKLEQIPVNIVSDSKFSELYPTLNDSSRINNPVISFNNTGETEVFLQYNSKYNFENEFTLAFWAQSNNWQQSQTTLLAGNYTPEGGYGVFVQNLSTYPFFVIPETGYGHLLYANDKIKGFLDKSVQRTPTLTASPEFIAIDFDSNVLITNSDGSGEIVKYDNTGKILTSNKLVDSPFTFLFENEQPVQLLCDINDQVKLISTNAIYTFDIDLNLISVLQWGVTPTTKAAFQYNSKTNEYNLILKDNVIDIKFLEEQEWFISNDDGNLYKKDITDENPILYADFNGERATTFAIDPNNNIWVLYGTNKLSIFNISNPPLFNPLLTTTIGSNRNHPKKNINFICEYDRKTQARKWKAIIYYNNETTLFILNLKGVLIEQYDINAFFNYNIIDSLKQNFELFEFGAQGDFTGYEHKRVFGKLTPYDNSSQIIFKAALQDLSKDNKTYKTFKSQFKINDWDLNSWQHFALTLKNKTFTLNINGQPKTKISYGGKYKLAYDNKPDFFIGTPAGSRIGYNKEIKTVSKIFNGLIENLKIYNYSIKNNDLFFFLLASVKGSNILWALPAPKLQYIEKIERMFKHKLPGSKSTFYTIKIAGSTIYDNETKTLIEEQIKQYVTNISPAYTDLLKVQWID